MKYKNTIKIAQHTEFEFVYQKNAENVANALALSGFYIKLSYVGGRWILSVYTDRI